MKVAWRLVLGLALAACSDKDSKPQGERTGAHVAAVQDLDGSWTLYSGKDIGTQIRSGKDIDGQEYFAVHVPDSEVMAARASASHMTTLSLEDAGANVAITIHQLKLGSTSSEPSVMETIHFAAGDPWLTGYAQVVAIDGKDPTGLIEVTKWKPPIPPSGQIGGSFYSSADVMEDAAAPHLNYRASDTATWPPTPDNWK